MAVHLLHLTASSSTSPSPLQRGGFHHNISHFPSSATPKRLTILNFISKPHNLRPSSQYSIVHGIESDTQSFANPDNKPKSKRKPKSDSGSYIWVNPNNPKSSQLREKSYDATHRSRVSLAVALNSCNPTMEDVSKILISLGDGFSEYDAVTVLNNMNNPETAPIAMEYFLSKLKGTRKVILYNVTLKVLRKCRDLESAEKLFDEMLERGIQPDNVTFSTLITCARFCSIFQKAVDLFEKMPEYGCVPDSFTCSAMIDVYGRAGDLYKALGLYDRARAERWSLDIITYSTLVKIYAKSGNFDGCLNVYEEMKANGVKPNMVIYNTLLDSMGKARKPWQAKNIYKDMIENGITPTWGTYNALLRGFCKARYGEDALKIYKEMKEKGFKFSVVHYNTMLSMCSDIGFRDEAAQIFQDMKDFSTFKPDIWTFSPMITVYSCNGQVDEAESVVNEMLQAGLQPNIYILTSLIQCYGKANRTDDVVRIFNQSFELGMNPDDRFCGSLLNVMTHTPKEELLKLTQCAEKANEKLGYVVRLLVEGNGDISVFKAASLQLFNTISPDVRKAYSNCLIDLCINLNLLEKACELLDTSLKLGIYSNIQSKSPAEWCLNLKTLSHGAALTALHIWMNDLSKELEYGEELPEVLVISTGHGKHKYSEKGVAGVIESHLRKLNSPFVESEEEPGWFLTTNDAAMAWLESRRMEEGDDTSSCGGQMTISSSRDMGYSQYTEALFNLQIPERRNTTSIIKELLKFFVIQNGRHGNFHKPLYAINIRNIIFFNNTHMISPLLLQ